MRRLLPLALVAGCAAPPPEVSPSFAPDSEAAAVDPFIGTRGQGNVFPGALMPFGLVSPSPHTRLPDPAAYLTGDDAAAAGYVDGDASIHGFGLTHLSGAGCPELGAPVLGLAREPHNGFDGYGSRFSKERAWPGYYGVDLDDVGVRIDVSASTRVAVFRLWPREGAVYAIFDVAQPLSWGGGRGEVHVTGPRTLEGAVDTGQFCLQGNHQRVYFAAELDRDAGEAGTLLDGTRRDARDADGAAAAYVRIDAPTEIAVGVSYVSVAGARANLAAERGGFDAVRSAAEGAWQARLGRVRVSGGGDAQRRMFYTALYHAFLHPNVASDVDGGYLAFGGGSGADAAHVRHSVYSLWDSYRTTFPLVALLDPDTARAQARSLLAMTIEAGAPPKWELCGSEVQMMVGDPADIALATAAAMGVLPDEPALLQQGLPIAMAAALDPVHRPGVDDYRSLGYLPIEAAPAIWGPVSTTLEYALADHALIRLGELTGASVDPAIAAGAESWRALLDPASGLFRPRGRDGAFVADFDPDASEGSASHSRAGGPGFVEGSAWQYGFFVAQAVGAHVAASGGQDAWTARFDELFAGGRYTVGNEPDLAFPYAASHLPGQAWRAARPIHDAIASAFGAGRDGLPGNDDAGALSSFLVWSALGLYPDDPTADDYALGTPMFDRAEIDLAGGTLVIDAAHASAAHFVPIAVTLDGAPLDGRVAWRQLAGATLRFELADTPR